MYKSSLLTTSHPTQPQMDLKSLQRLTSSLGDGGSITVTKSASGGKTSVVISMDSFPTLKELKAATPRKKAAAAAARDSGGASDSSSGDKKKKSGTVKKEGAEEAKVKKPKKVETEQVAVAGEKKHKKEPATEGRMQEVCNPPKKLKKESKE